MFEAKIYICIIYSGVIDTWALPYSIFNLKLRIIKCVICVHVDKMYNLCSYGNKPNLCKIRRLPPCKSLDRTHNILPTTVVGQ